MINNKNTVDIKDAFYFQWHFLESCNLRCSHCYQDNYNVKNMSLKDLLKIANNLDIAMAKWKKQGRVSLTGGEPFLKPKILCSLLDYFEKSDNFYWLGILTNGTLISNNIVEQLKKYPKLQEIQISLDGSDAKAHDAIRGKGSFDKAISGIKLLKENDFYVASMFTLHKQNMHDVNAVIDLVCNLGLDALTIERITPMSNDDIASFYIEPMELKSVYENIYKKKKEVELDNNIKIRVARPLWSLIDQKLGGFCPAGLTSLSIINDGTVYPCRRLEIPIGNILKDGLFKIWYKSEVLWKLRNKHNLTGKCKNCENISSCGGCRAIAYTVNKDYMAEDPQCWK